MRRIDYTHQFKRDYRRVQAGVLGKKLEILLRQALDYLVTDQPLPQRYKDHGLCGEWQDYRDCHLRPDLVLIYRFMSTDRLELVRLGSHSELGL